MAVVLIGMISALASGCGSSGGSSGSAEEDYPVLTAMADLDNADIKRMQKRAEKGFAANEITMDAVKTFVIGTTINQRDSTYINKPIFSIGAMMQNSFIDSNQVSATQDSSSIRITTNKSATEESDHQLYDFGASASYCGFKTSLSYHQENKSSSMASSGTTSIVMNYTNYGAYIQIMPSTMDDTTDFTRFVVGDALSGEAIKEYVDYTEKKAGKKGDAKYIDTIKIKDSGIYPDVDNVYAHIQLIAAMEGVFHTLKEQYNEFSGNEEVANSLSTNMLALKQNIADSIDSFYSRHGDSFVSTIRAMSYGLGTGTMSTTSNSSKQESDYSASVSMQYSSLVAGGSGSGTVAFAKAKGLAEEFSNCEVTAVARPAGTVDVQAWANDLTAKLKEDSAILNVSEPSGLAKAITATPPSYVDLKDPNEPPSSCFNSYNEWKEYMAEKKTAKNQDVKNAEKGEEQVEEKGVPEALKDGNSENEDDNPSEKRKSFNSDKYPGAQLYLAYQTELDELTEPLETEKAVAAQKADDSTTNNNLMRIDGMFVSGFDTTGYDQVIPALRPDLTIPAKVVDALKGFPNISTMLMTVDKLGQLDSYLRFLSNYRVSRLPSTLAGNYHAFYIGYMEQAMDMISAQMINGKDIPSDLMASFSQAMFEKEITDESGETAKGRLYEALGDEYPYNYVIKLLEPQRAKIWSEAPGGYIPMQKAETAVEGLEFCAARGTTTLPIANSEGKYTSTYIDYGVVMFDDPSENPLSIYNSDALKDYTVSPWFPIFQYNKGQMILLFLQNSGAYQVVYTKNYILAPSAAQEANAATPFNTLGFRENVALTSSVLDAVATPDNDFMNVTGEEVCTWDYSIYFAEGQSQDRTDKYNFLMITKNVDDVQGSVEVLENGYSKFIGHNGFVNFYLLTNPDVNFTVVDKATNAAHVMVPETRKIMLLLLPINKTTCGDDFNITFSYSTDLSPSEVIASDSFQGTYTRAINDTE